MTELWSQLRIYEDVGRWEAWIEPCDTQHWIDWTPDGERFARQHEEDGGKFATVQQAELVDLEEEKGGASTSLGCSPRV